MGSGGRVQAVAVAAAFMVWGCAGEDPVTAAAQAICDAIDEEPSDEAAFEGYELALTRERRDGMDEAELRAAVDERCGRVVSAIAAAVVEEEPKEEPEEGHEEEADPEPEFVELAALDWLDQTWVTECTSDGQQRGLRLRVEDGVGAVHRPDDGALTPVYVVDIDDIVFGDVTGDGHDDAIFHTQCVFASGEPFVEVWSHDDDGQPIHLAPVAHFSKFDAVVDHVEVVDGRLRIHTSEAGPDDTHPHLDGYHIQVVTDWSYDAGEWRSEEVSRVDMTPAPEPQPAPAPAPEPEPVPEPEVTACDRLGFPGQDEEWCAQTLRDIEECYRQFNADPDWVPYLDSLFEHVETGEIAVCDI